GQPGAGAEVDAAGALRQQLAERSAVEQVAFPEPAGFARTEEATLDGGTGEQFGVADKPGQATAGQRPRRGRRVAHDCGRMTTRRSGSTPSDSVSTPST